MKNFPVFTALLSALLLGGLSPCQAINLGGTTVAKDHFIVYLLIGHCNAAGRNVTSADGVTNPYAWNYKWQTTNRWVLAQEFNGGNPAGATSGYNGLTDRGTGGPGMPFLKGMVKQYPGYYFGIISNALTGSSVKINAPNCYTKVIGDRYSEVIQNALAVKSQVTLGGILCMIGEHEVAYGTTSDCNAIGNDIKTAVQNIRTDLGMPNLPFLTQSYQRGNTDIYAPTTTNGLIVTVKIDALPGMMTYCDTVGTIGCTMRDSHHFDTNGENTWAARAVAAIVRHGWMPLATSIRMGGMPQNTAHGISRANNSTAIIYNLSGGTAGILQPVRAAESCALFPNRPGSGFYITTTTLNQGTTGKRFVLMK
jgi:hypothetical protein